MDRDEGDPVLGNSGPQLKLNRRHAVTERGDLGVAEFLPANPLSGRG